MLLLQEWCGARPPESDIHGHYNTGIALVLFQMVDQNVSYYNVIVVCVLILAPPTLFRYLPWLLSAQTLN